jgi:hypothetical protein
MTHEVKPLDCDEDRARDFIRRSLEENRFWLRIMNEHALFLSEGFSRRDSDLIREANRFFTLFDQLLAELESLPPSEEAVFRFNVRVIQAVKAFRDFKQEVLNLVILCRIVGFNLPLLIDHIRREAEFFITVLVKLNQGIDEPIAAEVVRENVFWLRIMADHSRFIRNLLDPSERQLVQASQEFAQDFDQLLAQARDLSSMIEGVSPVLVVVGGHTLDEPSIIRLREAHEREKEREELLAPLETPPPTLIRFTQDVIEATRELRDFKQTATLLLRECKVLSILNPLLADHVRREAEKFLAVLAELEGRLQRKTVPIDAVEITRPAPPCPEIIEVSIDRATIKERDMIKPTAPLAGKVLLSETKKSPRAVVRIIH